MVHPVLHPFAGRRRPSAGARRFLRFLVENWAQAVRETGAASVVVADSQSCRAYAEQSAEAWLGYGRVDTAHPDGRAYAERRWREAVAAGQPVNAEFRPRRARPFIRRTEPS